MTSQREGLYEQLSKHSADPESYTNIFPLDDWTLSEYKVFSNFIHKGWLIQGDDYDTHYNGFIINPDWEGEPMWEEGITITEDKPKMVDKKAEKWDKLVQWIKSTKDQEDCDESIWDYLGDNLNVDTEGNDTSDDSEAVELFMLNCDDRDERLKAHYREGSVIDGKWVNNKEDDDEQYAEECPDCDKVLGQDVPIMCYNADEDDGKTLCNNCYWDNEYYKTDSNEDNQEEIQEYCSNQKWFYIKEYLTREFSMTDWGVLEEYAKAYEENVGTISVDKEAGECRDEDLLDYIQYSLIINDDEEEEDMDLNTKFGLMFMAKSVIKERTELKKELGLKK